MNNVTSGETQTYKKHYKFSIFLISALVVFGGVIVAVLLYLRSEGKLDAILEVLTKTFEEGGINSYLLLVWTLAIPLLLFILFLVNLKRRRKLRELQGGWQKAMKFAAEQQAAIEAKKHEKPPERFGLLGEIDRRVVPSVTHLDRTKTLESFCQDFRMFAAARLGLFYSITDIREFVASLAVSHIMILQGMSGTGKTSLAYAFGEFIGNPSTIVPVQPMWKERTDLLGYYNEFTKRFNETPLLQKIYEANTRKEMYIVVLDELNIARIEYYFAEFLSLLEIPDPESRYLEVVPDVWETDPQELKDGRVKLPDNMWFIGTANNDDSTFAISDKVYDRAMVLNLNRKSEPFDLPPQTALPRGISLTAEDFVSLVKKEQSGYEITCRNMERLRVLDEYLIEKFQITFGNRIMKQIKNYIPVYVSCGGEELDALDDIICKKVLRKLETQNAVYVRSEAERLCEFLSDLFGEDRMNHCKEYIRHIARNG